MKDLTGSGHKNRLKQSLHKLKAEIEHNSVTQGVMLSQLFGCSNMRGGNHHLFDDVGDKDEDFD